VPSSSMSGDGMIGDVSLVMLSLDVTWQVIVVKRESMTSDTGKQYQYKRSVWILENHVVKGK